VTTWKGREFEREWHRAMIEWIDGGRVGEHPAWQSSDDEIFWRLAVCYEPDYRTKLFRWKPKRTVTINGKVLVAPEVDAPAVGDCYWVGTYEGATDVLWDNEEYDKQQFAAGNVFLTCEDAQEMADWLVKCRRGET